MPITHSDARCLGWFMCRCRRADQMKVRSRNELQQGWCAVHVMLSQSTAVPSGCNEETVLDCGVETTW